METDDRLSGFCSYKAGYAIIEALMSCASVIHQILGESIDLADDVDAAKAELAEIQAELEAPAPPPDDDFEEGWAEEDWGDDDAPAPTPDDPDDDYMRFNKEEAEVVRRWYDDKQFYLCNNTPRRTNHA